MDALVPRSDRYKAPTDWRQWESPVQDWRIEPNRAHGRPFDTNLRSFSDSVVVDARLSQGCAGRRASASTGFVVVMFIADGREFGASGPQQLCFERGDVVVWNSRQPNLHFEIQKPLRKFMLFIPEDRVHGLWPDLISPSILHFACGDAFGPFLEGYFNAFLVEFDKLADLHASAAVDAGIELVARAARTQSKPLATARGALTVGTAIRYLEANLRDPDVDPDRVASHFGVSTRYVQILFAREGMTVSDWIRQQRLESCRKALQSKRPGETITEIAFTWGFNDPSHFSRLFRQRFGMRPRDYARRHAHGTTIRA